MGIEYTNRQRETYYLHQGKTKTGKPKYFMSRKPNGVPVDEMPEGYEIHENPERGLVSVRKIRSSKVLPLERAFLEKKTRELAGIEHFRVEIEADSLVVYTPEFIPGASVSLLSRIFGEFPGGEEAKRERIASSAPYHAMFCFTLVDEKKRFFSVQRWCFRGRIDDWHFLACENSLDRHADYYLPHLNEDSFFELI